jgi:hypothetical protein
MQRIESFTEYVVVSHKTGKYLWGQNVDITVEVRGAVMSHTHFYTMQFSRVLCIFVKWRGCVGNCGTTTKSSCSPPSPITAHPQPVFGMVTEMNGFGSAISHLRDLFFSG